MQITAQEAKERGAHFTPLEIAEYMAQRIAVSLKTNEGSRVTVLDPSCGDGALLSAMYDTLKQQGHSVDLIGVESDSATLWQANHLLSQKISPSDTIRLIHGDFLTCRPEGSQLALELESDAEDLEIPLADVIIANPPYVRTQVIGAEKSQQLAKRFGLSGKTDLYHAFFVVYHAFLKDSGVLGVITSNRYLYTKSGAAVRDCLNSHYSILEIDDLGDTKVFSAAVLPAIMFAKKRSTATPVKCMRVYECPDADNGIPVCSIADILRHEKPGLYKVKETVYQRIDGHVKNMDQSKEPWVLCSQEEEEWLSRVDFAAKFRIGDVAKVRVGIKTTADNVFISSKWDSLPVDSRPEDALLKSLLSSCDAQRWYLSGSPVNTVLYPHITVGGKRQVVELNDYPRARTYLQSHYDQLFGRSYVRKAKRQWYEIWVPQDPDAWKYSKIVFPDISSNARFHFDNTGAIVDGNCYWITTYGKDDDLLLLILGVANSNLMDRYHSSSFQNVLYSGKRRYLTQYVNQYPLPDPDSEASKRLVSYLRSHIEAHQPVDDAVVNELVDSAFNMDGAHCL